MFNINKEAEKALFLLSQNGYEAYLVGGCVRDSILKRPFEDYDITTNALPTEVKEVFKNFKTVDTGIKHGTVTVIIEKLPIEITTYRIDGEYSDNRHPDKVEYSRNIKDDLSRRDFTMNAICYNGEILDVFGGIEDIANKMIKCVGAPSKRFTEDALRVLRALRFSACLGFDIEQKTSDSIFTCAHLLKKVSGERISSELKKLLCGDFANDVISKYGGVFDILFDGECYSQTAEYIGKCKKDFAVRLSCLLLHKEGFREVLSKLKLDNKTSKRVISAIENYNIYITEDPVCIKRYLYANGLQNIKDVLALKKAYGRDTAKIENILNDIINRNECYSIKMLNVCGDDLNALGIKGKAVGDMLNTILDKVIDGTVGNQKNKIIDFIKEKYK